MKPEKRTSTNIEKTRYHSWKIGGLPKGCKLCVTGRKMVLLVTYVCPKNCFYCPLPENTKNRDEIWVNERQLNDKNDFDGLIQESIACSARGAAFCGGDPLTRTERACEYIRRLKKQFGKEYHIHLYTILESFRPKRLQALEEAGLDELKFHPDIFDDEYWKNLRLLFTNKQLSERKYSYTVGVELPCIPGCEKETKTMIDYFVPHVDFLNLNELEMSDKNFCELANRNLVIRGKGSRAVAGSRELGIKLLKYIQSKYPGFSGHFCTCKLKWEVQVRERLRLRAKNTKKDFDIITNNGTIVRGAIYLQNLKPGSEYLKKLYDMSKDDKNMKISLLKKFKEKILSESGLSESMLELDEQKVRLITNVEAVRKLSKKLKECCLVPAIVEQYPNWDQTEINVDFL